jgi:hypothetical protein
MPAYALVYLIQLKHGMHNINAAQRSTRKCTLVRTMRLQKPEAEQFLFEILSVHA